MPRPQTEVVHPKISSYILKAETRPQPCITKAAPQGTTQKLSPKARSRSTSIQGPLQAKQTPQSPAATQSPEKPQKRLPKGSRQTAEGGGSHDTINAPAPPENPGTQTGTMNKGGSSRQQHHDRHPKPLGTEVPLLRWRPTAIHQPHRRRRRHKHQRFLPRRTPGTRPSHFHQQRHPEERRKTSYLP